MHFLHLFFVAGLALVISAEEARYLCRLRVSNVSVAQNEAIREALRGRRTGGFDPQFESSGSKILSTHVWEGPTARDDETVAEVIFVAQVPDDAQIVAFDYPNIAIVGDLRKYQFNIHCSNGTISRANGSSTGYSFEFTDSYKITLGAAEIKGDRIRHPATLERQPRVDCYDGTGYVDPYSLDSTHRYVVDGESYVIGCSVVAGCRNGAVAAVSRCPPSLYPPTMQSVRNVGQCCDNVVEKAKVEQKGCPKDERGSAFEHPSQAYVPWQVRFGKECKIVDGRRPCDIQCDGVIIDKQWFLTTKSCLNDPSGLEFIRPAGAVYQPMRFRNITIIEVKDVDSNVDLALAKTSLPIVLDDWTTAIQKVNLPWSKSVCEKFLEKECHVLLGTQQRDEENNTSTVVGQVTDQATSQNLKRVKKQSNEPVLLGSGAVGWYEKANFLVGIYVGNAKKSVPGSWKDDTDSGDIISICPFVDSIRQKVQAGRN